MKYTFVVEDHDWFEHYGAQLRPQVFSFDSLKEAFDSYKESKKHDFYWEGDHKRVTHSIEIEEEIDNRDDFNF